MKLTPVEEKVWIAVQARIGFYQYWPRWRKHDNGFYFEKAPGSVAGEVSRRYNGKWIIAVGSINPHIVDDLTETAFLCVEYLYYRHRSIELQSQYREAAERREAPSRELTSADLIN